MKQVDICCECVHRRECTFECGTHSLKGLEEAVEDKVPDDFAVLKGGNIPYEEIGKHSQRGREKDPAHGRGRERRQQR